MELNENKNLDSFGIAGFIMSLLGILGTCSGVGFCLFLCPIGLFFSIIAARKSLRGFALAGLVLGGIGTFGCGILFVLAMVLGIGFLAILGISFFWIVPSAGEQLDNIRKISNEVQFWKEANKNLLPSDEQGDEIISYLLKPNEKEKYDYDLLDEKRYKISSSGLDWFIGNGNDIESIFSFEGSELYNKDP